MAGAINTNVLRVMSNQQMIEMENSARVSADEAANLPVMLGLAAHVLRCWQEAYRAKNLISPRLLNASRARMGEYSPEVLAEIKKFGGSEEYARITANKCRVAESWLRDVFLGQSDKPWTIKPTPTPSMDEDSIAKVNAQVAAEFAIMFAQTGQAASADDVSERVAQLSDAEQERLEEVARTAATNMERTMYSQLLEGGFIDALSAFMNDLTTFPAAHFKGPIYRKKPMLHWTKAGNTWSPVVTEEIIPEFERMDPLRCFPAPGATSPQEGYFIEQIPLSREDLYEMIGVQGFSEDAIRTVLTEFGRGGLTSWLTHTDIWMRASINGELPKPTSSANVTIDALEYNGPVQGRQLVEWGLDVREIADPDADYEANVWLIGRWVIKAQLNENPMKRRNIYKTCYEEVPGAYWGLGLVDILEDMQGIANAGVRALVNNMAMASGPQIGVNVERLPAGEDLTNITPYKIWQFKESQTGSATKALEFFQPESRAAEILQVIEKAYSFADDFSLIPRYMAGNNQGQGSPGRTASGLSMLMEAANKGLKGVVANVDTRIMTPMLEALYNFNMIHNPDESIKGDAQVVARGAISLMQLEALQLRRNEFLVATNNPTDNQIMGLEGRAEILRETAKGLQMDVNRVIPPRGSQYLPSQPGQPPNPVPQPGQEPQNQTPGALPAGAGSGETLMNGAPVTDNFSKNSMTPA